MILISFCIPVYNQSNLVKECIESILDYEGKDIEIVINDDCSTENIETMISQYRDSRICYYRNEMNLGHDKNIIAGFKHAKGRYVFLLRSRDKIISSKIPMMIEKISSNSSVVYLTGGAEDETGKTKLEYENTIYEKGWDALKAHNKLYIHPSGSIYRLDMVDLSYIEKFLSLRFDSNRSFVVHNLLRLQLSQLGNFMTIKDNVWIYTNTSRAKDVAVNSMKNGEFVYSSEHMMRHFDCEVQWCKDILSKEMFVYEYDILINRYLKKCTWEYKLGNQDIRMQRHYDFKPKLVNIRAERKRFIKHLVELQNDLFKKGRNASITLMLSKAIVKNVTIDAFKYYIMIWLLKLKCERLIDAINRFRYSARLKEADR